MGLCDLEEDYVGGHQPTEVNLKIQYAVGLSNL